MTNDVEVLQAMVHDLRLDHPNKPTLLDHFAGMAMQALLASKRFWDEGGRDEYGEGPFSADDLETHHGRCKRTAICAYDMAEAMLRQRAQRLTKEASQ